MRNFAEWFSKFKSSISGYAYYVDFGKVHRNIDTIKVELNILNSLIGSKNIEDDFEALIARYPEVLKCIPLLLAVRGSEMYAMDGDGEFLYSFKNTNYPPKQYKVFMRKTGLFDLMENHILSNLIDYATGIETNFYAGGGSKLNETARSYKAIALESRKIDGFEFVWVTDGKGWRSARNNLEETFDAMENIFNIADLEDGIMERLFV